MRYQRLVPAFVAVFPVGAFGQFTIYWRTVDAGGATLVGGATSLRVTTGQPDASLTTTGGTITLIGGYWGVAAPSPCSGDVNGDFLTNVSDFNILAGNFGDGPSAVRSGGDLSGDGFVNVSDFNILAGDFGCTN